MHSPLLSERVVSVSDRVITKENASEAEGRERKRLKSESGSVPSGTVSNTDWYQTLLSSRPPPTSKLAAAFGFEGNEKLCLEKEWERKGSRATIPVPGYTGDRPWEQDRRDYLGLCWRKEQERRAEQNIGAETAEPHYKYSERRLNKRLDVCKQKHRSSLALNAWQRYDYPKLFPAYRTATMSRLDQIAQNHVNHAHRTHYNPDPTFPFAGHSPLSQWNSRALVASSASASSVFASHSHSEHDRIPSLRELTPAPVSGGVDHIHCKDFSVARFRAEYEGPYLPVVIHGLADEWPAVKNWSIPSLNTSKYRNCNFKCGEDDDGYSVKVKLKYFLQYANCNKDDSPLYIFDASFDDHKPSDQLLEEYKPPPYWRDDLFDLVPTDRRAPWRWFLMGPERSGTSLHIDPLGTSAWNTLLYGVKRWVLFKPGASKKLVKGTDLRHDGEDSEGVTWFLKVLPRIIEQEEKKAEGSSLGIIEFCQYPGETVFVPGGWWHAVINLTDTIAVTQNYCSVVNFPSVWRQTRKGRKKMSVRWLRNLQQHKPELYEMAMRLNKEDNYNSDSDSDSSKKKRKHKHKKKKGGMMGMCSDDERDGDDRRPRDGPREETSKSSRSASSSSGSSSSSSSSSPSESDTAGQRKKKHSRS